MEFQEKLTLVQKILKYMHSFSVIPIFYELFKYSLVFIPVYYEYALFLTSPIASFHQNTCQTDLTER